MQIDWLCNVYLTTARLGSSYHRSTLARLVSCLDSASQSSRPSECSLYLNKYSYLSISSYPKGYQMLHKAVIYIGDNGGSS